MQGKRKFIPIFYLNTKNQNHKRDQQRIKANPLTKIHMIFYRLLDHKFETKNAEISLRTIHMVGELENIE